MGAKGPGGLTRPLCPGEEEEVLPLTHGGPKGRGTLTVPEALETKEESRLASLFRLAEPCLAECLNQLWNPNTGDSTNKGNSVEGRGCSLMRTHYCPCANLLQYVSWCSFRGLPTQQPHNVGATTYRTLVKTDSRSSKGTFTMG